MIRAVEQETPISPKKAPSRGSSSPKPKINRSDSWLEEAVVLFVDDLMDVPVAEPKRNRRFGLNRMSTIFPRDYQRKFRQIIQAVLVLTFIALVSGWVKPEFSLWSARAQVWGFQANGQAVFSSLLLHGLALLLPQLLPMLVLLSLMAVQLRQSLGRTDKELMKKVVRYCWRDPLGVQPWHMEASIGALLAAGEEIFFRLLLSHAAMACVQLLRLIEHSLGSAVGVSLVLTGAVITIKEVAFGDVQPTGVSDDARVLKRVGTGLLMVAAGIFQMHTFHINGAESDSYFHIFHTDEAHRMYGGHHSMRDATTGVQIPLVSSKHAHHEIDQWVHQYGSNGMVFFVAQLLLAVCNGASFVGTFNTTGPVRHAFVQGALMANLMYAAHKAQNGRYAPGVAQLVAWLSGLVLVHCMTTHGLFYAVVLHMVIEATYVLWSSVVIRWLVPTICLRGYPLFEWRDEPV